MQFIFTIGSRCFIYLSNCTLMSMLDFGKKQNLHLKNIMMTYDPVQKAIVKLEAN